MNIYIPLDRVFIYNRSKRFSSSWRGQNWLCVLPSFLLSG